MSLTLDELFCDYVAGSMAKQQMLRLFLDGERARWQLDVRAGTLRLTSTNGDAHTFAVQVLGSESDADNTWLWAWANKQLLAPERCLRAASMLRQLGEREAIREFTEGLVALHGTDLALRMVLAISGICNAACYYIGVYDSGRAYLLIDDPSFPPVIKEDPLRRVVLDFPKLIAHVAIPDHRRAFQGMAQFYGLEIEESGAAIVVTGPDGASAQATFDGRHRLSSLEAAVISSSPTPARRAQPSGQPLLLRKIASWGKRRPS